jgi:hypothetical protein
LVSDTLEELRYRRRQESQGRHDQDEVEALRDQLAAAHERIAELERKRPEPGRLERRWAEIHPEAAAEWERRRGASYG